MPIRKREKEIGSLDEYMEMNRLDLGREDKGQ